MFEPKITANYQKSRKNNPKWICFRYQNLIWARLKMSRILIQRKILFLMEMPVWTIPTVSIFLIILTNKTRPEARFHKYPKPSIWLTSAAVIYSSATLGQKSGRRTSATWAQKSTTWRLTSAALTQHRPLWHRPLSTKHRPLWPNIGRFRLYPSKLLVHFGSNDC